MEKRSAAIPTLKYLLVAALVLLFAVQHTFAAFALGPITGVILDYRTGYITLTTGQSYPVSENVKIVDAASGQSTTTKLRPGLFARLTLDARSQVAEIAVSRTRIQNVVLRPPSLQEVAVPLTPSHPEGDFAKVTFIVLVPATTLLTDQVYMSTSETSWTPTAVRMDRVDARHFRVIIEVPVGGTFLYLYTRGSPQSLERAPSGLQRPARTLTLTSTDAQTQRDAIEHWGDEVGTSLLPPPQTFPTPYNPAPFPNLPPSPRP